jgi:hypothetical protein
VEAPPGGAAPARHESPARDFEAVVIGEPQHAFYGSQFGMTFPVFIHYAVGLLVPEVGGAIDPGSDAHDLVMALYGGMSKSECNRIKIRVRSAMKAQTDLEGRCLGGRPPYGYRLADAGPHPNPPRRPTARASTSGRRRAWPDSRHGRCRTGPCPGCVRAGR